MRYLHLGEVLELHRRLIERFGGSTGILDINVVRSALHQPRMTFDGEDLYPTLPEKASALCHSLVANHPFVDGNKRVGHAAMAVFLDLNGYCLNATADDQEVVILRIASGAMSRDEFAEWLSTRIQSRTSAEDSS